MKTRATRLATMLVFDPAVVVTYRRDGRTVLRLSVEQSAGARLEEPTRGHLRVQPEDQLPFIVEALPGLVDGCLPVDCGEAARCQAQVEVPTEQAEPQYARAKFVWPGRACRGLSLRQAGRASGCHGVASLRMIQSRHPVEPPGPVEINLHIAPRPRGLLIQTPSCPFSAQSSPRRLP